MSSFVFFCVTLVLLWCFARCFKLEIITHCANWWRCIFSACQNISTLSFLHFHQSHHEPEFISHCHFPRGRDPMGNEAYEVSLLIKINQVFVLINKTRYVMLAYLLCLRRISGSLQEQVRNTSNPLTMYVWLSFLQNVCSAFISHTRSSDMNMASRQRHLRDNFSHHFLDPKIRNPKDILVIHHHF